MSEFLNVALPKGRLGERVYKMFAEAGFPCDELLDPKRKLIFENPEAKRPLLLGQALGRCLCM